MSKTYTNLNSITSNPYPPVKLGAGGYPDPLKANFYDNHAVPPLPIMDYDYINHYMGENGFSSIDSIIVENRTLTDALGMILDLCEDEIVSDELIDQIAAIAEELLISS